MESYVAWGQCKCPPEESLQILNVQGENHSEWEPFTKEDSS